MCHAGVFRLYVMVRQFFSLQNELLKDNIYHKEKFICLINDSLFDDDTKFSDVVANLLNDNQNKSHECHEENLKCKPKYFVQFLENLVSGLNVHKWCTVGSRILASGMKHLDLVISLLNFVFRYMHE